MSAQRVSSNIDVENLIAALEDRTPQYISTIRSGVDSAIRGKDTADLLEMQVWKTEWNEKDKQDVKVEKIYYKRPPFNTDWAELMYKYMRRKSVGSNRTIEAGIEQVVAKAVMDASEEFFSQEGIEALVDALSKQFDTNEKLRGALMSELSSSGKFVGREIKDLINTHGKSLMAAQLHNTMVGAAHHVMGTSAGHMLMTALMTPAVKLIIVKAVMTAVGHAMVQQLLHLVVKKVGITALVGVIFGAGGVSVLGWIAFPIIAGVLTYQYHELPNTFAKKMAPEVAEKVRSMAPEMYRAAAQSFRDEVTQQLLKQGVDKFWEQLHDIAVST